MSRVGAYAARAVKRPSRLIAAGFVVGVGALHLWIDPSNPPGFHRDEASLAFNAHTISQTLRDENGGYMPLYLESFGDYKSSVFVYVVASVFRVVGPDPQVARAVAAVAVLAAIVLVGILAYRRSADIATAVAVIVLGGLTPWLFELGRVAVEVTLMPVLLVGLLLLLDAICVRAWWSVGSGALVGLFLAALAYTYAGGRLLGPLMAIALLVFVARARVRWLAAAWVTFAMLLMPLALYTERHPGALTARYQATTFVTDEMTRWDIIRTFLGNYSVDLRLWEYVTGGDPKPHIRVDGTGMLLAAVVILAVAGVVLGWRTRDRWFAYSVVVALLVPVPAALTQDRFNGYRLALLPVMLLILAMPTVAWLSAAARRSRVAAAAVAILLVATAVQFTYFMSVRVEKGEFSRSALYEAAVPVLLTEAFEGGRSVYMDFDEPRAHAHARWFAVTHGLPLERAVILADGGVPPDGGIVFGRSQPCDFTCIEFARGDEYWLARTELQE